MWVSVLPVTAKAHPHSAARIASGSAGDALELGVADPADLAVRPGCGPSARCRSRSPECPASASNEQEQPIWRRAHQVRFAERLISRTTAAAAGFARRAARAPPQRAAAPTIKRQGGRGKTICIIRIKVIAIIGVPRCRRQRRHGPASRHDASPTLESIRHWPFRCSQVHLTLDRTVVVDRWSRRIPVDAACDGFQLHGLAHSKDGRSTHFSDRSWHSSGTWPDMLISDHFPRPCWGHCVLSRPARSAALSMPSSGQSRALSSGLRPCVGNCRREPRQPHRARADRVSDDRAPGEPSGLRESLTVTSGTRRTAPARGSARSGRRRRRGRARRGSGPDR